MKNKWFILLAVLLTTLACVSTQPATAPVSDVETMVAATMQTFILTTPPPATLPPTAPPGSVVSYQNVSFFLPEGVGTNALAGTIPAVLNDQQGAPWEIAPEHIKFELGGYPLFGTFHTPYILIYPAPGFAALSEAAAISITRLQAILNGSAAPTAENLPTIPFFNAAQVFAAQIQTVQFKNGSGVRFLTEYAQYYATANNKDMFYQFQGLTNDGKYYILAILPASHPLLAMDEDPASPLPAGGIPFPGIDDQNAINAYYPAVVNLLNTATPGSFTPTLNNLDALIQSLNIQ